MGFDSLIGGKEGGPPVPRDGPLLGHLFGFSLPLWSRILTSYASAEHTC